MKFWVAALLASLISLQAGAVKILQIGDSHTVGYFGQGLFDSFKKSGATIHAMGLAGSSGKHWSSDKPAERSTKAGFIERPAGLTYPLPPPVPKLSTLLTQDKPDLLVVELGDNFASYRELALTAKTPGQRESLDKLAQAEIQKILKQIEISGVKLKECFWVGPTWASTENQPPYYKNNARATVISDMIEKAITGKCNYVNSMKIVEKSEIKTGKDHLHFGQTSGTLWGQRAYQAISHQSGLLNLKGTLKAPVFIPPPQDSLHKVMPDINTVN